MSRRKHKEIPEEDIEELQHYFERSNKFQACPDKSSSRFLNIVDGLLFLISSFSLYHRP